MVIENLRTGAGSTPLGDGEGSDGGCAGGGGDGAVIDYSFYVRSLSILQNIAYFLWQHK